MSDRTRRTFLGQLGAMAVLPALNASAGVVSAGAAATWQASGPYDLLIAGGRVVDPVQGIAAPRDVAIAGGKIAQVAANIDRRQARQVYDASGKLVTPGLIDVHGHVYDSAITISIDPDIVGIPKGVTTIVDAGSTGAGTFAGLRKYVIERAKTRVYAMLNISTIGLVVANELYLDPKMIDPGAAIKTILENRPLILGIKVRINGRDDEVPHDLDVLKKAREASDQAGVPIMMHWTNEPRLLAILKKGDIVTHPFNPPRSGPSCLGPDGRVLPQILELKDRGILVDFAHGSHLLWETAEKAAHQGWYPDTISTDIHRAHVAPNGTVIDLVTTMSKFVYLGLTVDQAIEKVTAAPARMLNFPEKLGTLESGTTADVSVLSVERGSFELLDSTRQKRVGQQRIVPVATVRAGRLFRPMPVIG
jgi:dihydroorotase